jgi:hypothetical protein
MTNFFFSEDAHIINGDTESIVEANGAVYSQSISATSCLTLTDTWATSVNKFSGDGVIGSTNIEELYNVDKNFVKDEDGNTPSTYMYDTEKGILTFKDNTLTKYDLLNCPFPQSDEVTLHDMVRDLEMLSSFSRIADFGPIFDVKFRQINFGDYKYYNTFVCSNIARTLGYLSFDKVINDEQARRKNQTELYEKYKDTDRTNEFPPYTGFLISEDYLTGGWVSVDQVIHSVNEDTWAYDQESSLAIRTKKIKDRKRAIVHLLMTYASSIWELNSDNKIVDFGVRIKDRATGKTLDHSDVKNGMNSFVGNTLVAHFVGDLGSAPSAPGENSPSEFSCDEQTSCGKVFVDKCDNTNFKVKCDQNDGDVGGTVHELMPQIRINPIVTEIEKKPDVLYTVDAIHWTTGINELQTKDGVDLSWINALIKEFGESNYLSTFLVENRAFHYVGGTYLDGFAANGFNYNVTNSDESTTDYYLWGNRTSSEVWNGTAWSLSGDVPTGRALGIGGGTSEFAMTGWGCTANTFTSTNEPSLASLTPTVSLNSGFYLADDVGGGLVWSSLSLSPIIEKHSVAGIAYVEIVKNGSSEGEDTFGKKNITALNKCVEGCLATTSAVNNFFSPNNEETTPSVLKNVSGICFNGTVANEVTFNNINDYDLDSNFIYFSYADAQKFKSAKEMIAEQEANPTATISPYVSLIAKCSYVDNTKRYPIKTVGTCYVGTSTHGIATGGKTSAIIAGCVGMGNVKESLYDRYFNPTYWNQNNDSIIKYAYEWNNVAWTRVQDIAEDVSYHCGVGDEKWAIFWGGLHGSLELANVESQLEDCNDWCSTANIFGGVCHRDSFCSLDGSFRYTDFATEINDIHGNVLFKIGNPKDICKIGAHYTDAFTSSLNIVWNPVGYAWSISGDSYYGQCSYYLSDCETYDVSGNPLGIIEDGVWKPYRCTRYEMDTTATSAENDNFYFESWEDEVYHPGHFKQHAVAISGDMLRVSVFMNGTTVISDPTFFTLPSVSAACTYDDTYDWSTCRVTGAGMVIDGGYTLASRENVLYNQANGYRLHPSTGGLWLWSRPTKGENLFHPDNFDPLTVEHDFSTYGTSAAGEIYSFFVGPNKEGLVQSFYGERKDSFVEQWSNPYSTQIASITASTLWDGEMVQASSISGFSGTTSVGRFLTPALSGNISSYDLPEVLAEIVDISFNKGNFEIGGYDYSAFTGWFYSSETDAFPVRAYDSHNKWFNDVNYVQVEGISGSSLRDRAALFPWNELICGNADNHAKYGTYAWTWGYNGSLYLAECIFADTVTISGDDFTDSLGRTVAISASNYDDTFWREVFRIRHILANGSVRFDYNITYDESLSDSIVTMPATNISGAFTLFGNDSKFREVDEDLWNVKNFHDISQVWISGGPEYKTTTSYEWTKETANVPSEAYPFIYRNLCDVTKSNFNASPSPTGMFVAATISGSVPVWMWSVPYITDTVDISGVNFFIHSSDLVNGYSAEVVRTRVASDKTYVSRTVAAGPTSSGIGFFDIGKTGSMSGANISAAPFNFSVENSTVVHPSYDDIKNFFPWCVLADDGTHGPTAMVDMCDISGNYWVAIGDTYNKKKSEITEDYYVNTYTIAMVPPMYLNEFNRLVLASENRRIAMDTFVNYSKATDLNPTGVLANNKATRSREAVMELLNTKNGENIFGTYVKIFEYVAKNAYTSDYMDEQLAVVNDPTVYVLPFSSYISGTIDNVQEFTIATEKDNECIECDVCLGVDETTLPPWIEHIHDEWVTRNLESWGNGPFGRSNFNAWLAAGCDTKWGVSLWSTLQGGRIWFNYKASDLRVDISKRIISYAVIVATIAVDDLTNDVYENVPALVKYDEFHFDMDAYIDTPLVQTALTNNPEEIDNVSFCKAPSTVFVPDSLWATCPQTVDISGNVLTDVVTEDIDPSVGYTEWVTSFIQEYKKDEEITDKNNVEKYYNRYNIASPGSNCLINREEITDQEWLGTSWRRFQDNVGLGGPVPIMNTPTGPNKDHFDLTAFNFGQKAFGDPDKAIICGGYSVSRNGELQSSSGPWGYMTNGPTFKWNRTVISPEDSLNSNYKHRTISPFYNSGNSTFSHTNMGAIVFDVSKQVNIERAGSVTFDGTTKTATASFEAIPSFVSNKTAYSISLTANDNVKVWWSDKTDTTFAINIEIEGWRGTVDWKITLIADVPTDQVDGTENERKTYDTFEEA